MLDGLAAAKALLGPERTAERRRATVRGHLGVRECSTADAEKLTGWLAVEVACKERRFELVREELLGECRRERIEPPADTRVERIVRLALYQAEEALCTRGCRRRWWVDWRRSPRGRTGLRCWRRSSRCPGR